MRSLSPSRRLVYLASQGKRGFGLLAWLQQLPRSLHLEALLPDSLRKYREAWLVFSAGVLAVMRGVIVYVASDKH